MLRIVSSSVGLICASCVISYILLAVRLVYTRSFIRGLRTISTFILKCMRQVLRYVRQSLI